MRIIGPTACSSCILFVGHSSSALSAERTAKFVSGGPHLPTHPKGVRAMQARNIAAATEEGGRARWTLEVVNTAALSIVYARLLDFADAAAQRVGLSADMPLGGAVRTFLCDPPKVRLSAAIGPMTRVIQTFFGLEGTRAQPSGKRLGAGNVCAASLGFVAPLWSCLVVPLFIGFVSASVPISQPC